MRGTEHKGTKTKSKVLAGAGLASSASLNLVQSSVMCKSPRIAPGTVEARNG